MGLEPHDLTTSRSKGEGKSNRVAEEGESDVTEGGDTRLLSGLSRCCMKTTMVLVQNTHKV